MDLLRTLDEKVSPGRAAVVTVDVQNDFCHQDGFLGELGAPHGADPGHGAAPAAFPRRRA